MWTGIIAAGLLIGSGTAAGAQALSRVIFSVVARGVKGDAAGMRGNLQGVARRGRRVAIDRSGSVLPGAVLLPDRHGVVYRTGTYYRPVAGEKIFEGKLVVLWRDGSVRLRIAPTENAIIDRFRVVDAGRRVGLRTRGLDGSIAYELYDLGDARLVKRFDKSFQGQAPPAWAVPLMIKP